MNRTSRRSATEAAEALLEAGRTQPALHYDVELGLARHHHWLRSEAPVPEWANASAGGAAKSLLPVVIKTIVSAVMIGALGVTAWHTRGRLQPAAAKVEPSSPALEPAPSVQAVTTSEARTARPVPMPLSDQGRPSHQAMRRTFSVEAHPKRTSRYQRAHKELASARAASGRSAHDWQSPDATPARVQPDTCATARASEDATVEPATRTEVAAAPERKPISSAHSPAPEPRQQAQTPDDLIEMRQVATAEQLLERSPARALALVQKGDERFASGYFQEERAYIATMALIRLGRMDEARARAARFAKQFPALPYGARIRSALEAREAAARGAP